MGGMWSLDEAVGSAISLRYQTAVQKACTSENYIDRAFDEQIRWKASGASFHFSIGCYLLPGYFYEIATLTVPIPLYDLSVLDLTITATDVAVSFAPTVKSPSLDNVVPLDKLP